MSFRSKCLSTIFALLAVGVPARAQRLSPLATAPDWRRLDAFQESITKEEFQRLVDTVFAPGGAAAGVIECRDSEAVIFKTLTPPETMTFRFAKDAAGAKAPPRYWRPAARLGPSPSGKPLAGVRIALDPGHIGGEWAAMEERSFGRAGDKPVQEGDMTLLVAKLVAAQLAASGAEVTLVRDGPVPSSPFTVDALRPAARKEMELLGVPDIRDNYEGRKDPLKSSSVQWHAEKYFYRIAEIRERGRRVNDKIRPDLAVCIHFNADEWGDPAEPAFTERNDLHVLVNGCYGAGELRYDDERFEMLARVLSRSHTEELAVAASVANALAQATGLSPFRYTTGNAVQAGPNEYLWARNLLANRLFDCPVVYLEPYRMNHPEVYARIQAGDFDGEREVAGKMRRSIFREYADAIVAGLRAYYTAARQPQGVVPK